MSDRSTAKSYSYFDRRPTTITIETSDLGLAKSAVDLFNRQSVGGPLLSLFGGQYYVNDVFTQGYSATIKLSAMAEIGERTKGTLEPRGLKDYSDSELLRELSLRERARSIAETEVNTRLQSFELFRNVKGAAFDKYKRELSISDQTVEVFPTNVYGELWKPEGTDTTVDVMPAAAVDPATGVIDLPATYREVHSGVSEQVSEHLAAPPQGLVFDYTSIRTNIARLKK